MTAAPVSRWELFQNGTDPPCELLWSGYTFTISFELQGLQEAPFAKPPPPSSVNMCNFVIQMDSRVLLGCKAFSLGLYVIKWSFQVLLASFADLHLRWPHRCQIYLAFMPRDT